MRVRVLFLTSGIRAVLSCSLNISCSSPSHASLGPQPAAGRLAVPAYPSSPAQTSSSSSEAASSHVAPPLARHVRRTVSALGRLQRRAPAGGRGCRGRGTCASGGRDCSDGGKAGDGGTGSSKGRSRSSSGSGCSACDRAQGSARDTSISVDDDRDNELKLARETAREQAAQWAAEHPQGRRGGSPDGHGHAGGVLGGGACGGRVLDGGGSPDRRGRADGWVDGDHGLYRRRDSPSLDRYHGHHGIQVIVRDAGPGGGWPTLTKTNYVEWAAVMRVRLQVRHMWEAVRYGDVDYYEDRWVLDALIAAVPSDMQFSLSKKRTAKEAWDFARSGRTWPSSQVKTLMTSLSVLTLCSRR
jgi:hypothetical protein